MTSPMTSREMKGWARDSQLEQSFLDQWFGSFWGFGGGVHSGYWGGACGGYAGASGTLAGGGSHVELPMSSYQYLLPWWSCASYHGMGHCLCEHNSALEGRQAGADAAQAVLFSARGGCIFVLVRTEKCDGTTDLTRPPLGAGATAAPGPKRRAG